MIVAPDLSPRSTARRPGRRARHPVRAEPDLRGLRPSARPARSPSSARPVEVGRNAFHAPPMHLDVRPELRSYAGATRLELVTTAGFEFVRPGRDDLDRRPTFQPNSLL